jgi:hypothetical protein
MKKPAILIAAAAISFGVSAISFAATPRSDISGSGAVSGDVNKGGVSGSGSASGGVSGSGTAQSCEGMSGSARDNCMQSNTARTPGRSEDAASREGGRTPGRSEDSASRTGTPPGQFNSSPMGNPAAGGMDKNEGSSKGGSTTK